MRSVSGLTAPRAVTLQEAATIAPFTIWVPRRPPPGWETQVHYVPSEERPRSPASVGIRYWREDATAAADLSESAVLDSGPFEDFA